MLYNVNLELVLNVKLILFSVSPPCFFFFSFHNLTDPNLMCLMLLKIQINGSLARRAIRELMAKGVIRMVAAHSSQQIYTRATNT